MQPFVDSGWDGVLTKAEHAAAFEDLYAEWTSGWESVQDFDLPHGRVTLCRDLRSGDVPGSEYQVLRFWSVAYAPIPYYRSMVSVDYQGSSAAKAIDAVFKAADLLTD